MDESIAEVRAHRPGLFVVGALDVVVVNVAKDAIWARKANLPHGSPSGALDPRLFLAPGEVPDAIKLPDPTRPRETQQEQFLREMEIDPHECYPRDVDRDITDK